MTQSSNRQGMRNLIQARVAGNATPVMNIVKTNPGYASLLSKLVKPPEAKVHDNQGNRKLNLGASTGFRAISNDVSQRTEDAETIMELFPDMELSAQILISSIISPKDMNSTGINYKVPDNLATKSISALLINSVKDYFQQRYKIEPLIPDILEDVLFGSGSYPVAVIPENSVDDLINGQTSMSMEAFAIHMNPDMTFKSTGVLGSPDVLPKVVANTTKKPTALSLEMFADITADVQAIPHAHQQMYMTGASLSEKKDPGGQVIDYESKPTADVITLEGLVVTDNPNALKMPAIVEARRAAIMRKKLAKAVGGFGIESITDKEGKPKKLSDQELTSLLFKNRNNTHNTMVKVKTDDELSRRSIGQGLIMKLPSESVMPVYTPGHPEKHVGYFVMIDNEGNPVSMHSKDYNFDDLRSNLSGGQNMSSHLLNRAAATHKTSCNEITFDQAAQVYADIVEADLLSRMRNGIVGTNVAITKNQEIYRIMLARVLRKQGTQLLYLPKELLTYFAYKYTKQGIGKSLLDNMRLLNSMRAMLDFANVMASVKNSIGRSRVNMKLSETDPDPTKTIEMTIHEYSKLRQGNFPLSITAPGDIVDWVNKAGIEYSFEGHPGLPETKVEFSEVQTNYPKPDTELQEDLRKRSIMATGLSPETVDQANSVDFATTAVQNSLLLAKRVKKIQDAISPLISDLQHKILINDGEYVGEVKKLIRDNWKSIMEVENPPDLGIENTPENEPLIVHLMAMEFISNFESTMSPPDSITLENQMKAFEAHEEAVDKALSYYISSEIAPSSMSGEEASQRVDEVRAMVKAYYMRRWMAENNVLPELAEMSAVDDQDKPVINMIEEQRKHVTAITRSIAGLLEKQVPAAQAADASIQKITGGEDLGESSVSAPESGGGGGSDFSGSDDSSSSDDNNDDTGGTGSTDDLNSDMPSDLPDLGSMG